MYLKTYMDDETPCQLKVIYKERNTHILNVARTLNSISYIITRIIILPLLYSLREKTGFNIVFFFLTVAYIFRFNFLNFESKIKYFVPALTLFIVFESIYSYSDKLSITAKDIDPPSPPSVFSGKIIRMWVICCVSLGFASIIWTAKFVFTKLFVIRQDFNTAYFTYNCEDGKIEIDFSLWVHQHLRWWTWIINSLHVYLNDIYMTGVIIFCLINPDIKYLLVIMLVLFAYTIIMRFKRSYTTIAMEQRAATTLATAIKIVVVILFVLDFLS